MRPLIVRDLNWIDHAPVSVTRTRRIAASSDEIWAAIADHESWPQWFDALTEVEVLGSGEGVGGRRRVHIRSIAIEEEFLAWEPGERFAFVLTGANKPGIKSMVEDVRLESVGDGATTVSYTQALEPVAATVTAPLLRRVLPKGLDKGLAGLARHVGG